MATRHGGMTGTEVLGLPTRILTGLLRELLIDIANQKGSAFRFDDPARAPGHTGTTGK